MAKPEPKWLDVDYIIEIHERVVEATGGSQGIRDTVEILVL